MKATPPPTYAALTEMGAMVFLERKGLGFFKKTWVNSQLIFRSVAYYDESCP